MTIRLLDICHGRSGDKGRDSNVGLIAWHPDLYDALLKATPVEAVQAHLGEIVRGTIDRYELPRMHAINFVLHDALDGGGVRSLRIDAQGKALCEAVLRMPVEIDEATALLSQRHSGRSR